MTREEMLEMESKVRRYKELLILRETNQEKLMNIQGDTLVGLRYSSYKDIEVVLEEEDMELVSNYVEAILESKITELNKKMIQI